MSMIDRSSPPIQHIHPLSTPGNGVAQGGVTSETPPLVNNPQSPPPQDTWAHGYGQQEDTKTQLPNLAKEEVRIGIKCFEHNLQQIKMATEESKKAGLIYDLFADIRVICRSAKNIEGGPKLFQATTAIALHYANLYGSKEQKTTALSFVNYAERIHLHEAREAPFCWDFAANAPALAHDLFGNSRISVYDVRKDKNDVTTISNVCKQLHKEGNYRECSQKLQETFSNNAISPWAKSEILRLIAAAIMSDTSLASIEDHSRGPTYSALCYKIVGLTSHPIYTTNGSTLSVFGSKKAIYRGTTSLLTHGIRYGEDKAGHLNYTLAKLYVLPPKGASEEETNELNVKRDQFIKDLNPSPPIILFINEALKTASDAGHPGARYYLGTLEDTHPLYSYYEGKSELLNADCELKKASKDEYDLYKEIACKNKIINACEKLSDFASMGDAPEAHKIKANALAAESLSDQDIKDDIDTICNSDKNNIERFFTVLNKCLSGFAISGWKDYLGKLRFAWIFNTDEEAATLTTRAEGIQIAAAAGNNRAAKQLTSHRVYNTQSRTYIISKMENKKISSAVPNTSNVDTYNEYRDNLIDKLGGFHQ